MFLIHYNLASILQILACSLQLLPGSRFHISTLCHTRTYVPIILHLVNKLHGSSKAPHLRYIYLNSPHKYSYSITGTQSICLYITQSIYISTHMQTVINTTR